MRAAGAWKGSGEAATETVWFEVREATGPTEFLGYETETAEGMIQAVIKGGKQAKSLKSGDEGAVIVNQTPFYGESGGQVGDRGVIRGPKGVVFRVLETQKKLSDLLVHLGVVEKGSFKPGDVAELVVDPNDPRPRRPREAEIPRLSQPARGDERWGVPRLSRLPCPGRAPGGAGPPGR